MHTNMNDMEIFRMNVHVYGLVFVCVHVFLSRNFSRPMFPSYSLKVLLCLFRIWLFPKMLDMYQTKYYKYV